MESTAQNNLPRLVRRTSSRLIDEDALAHAADEDALAHAAFEELGKEIERVLEGREGQIDPKPIESTSEADELLNILLELSYVAVEQRNIKLYRCSSSVIDGVLQLIELYEAFQKADGQIKGVGGVASLLGLTRNGVYTRLDIVGVNPKTMRHSNFHEVVRGSRIFDELRELVQDEDNSPPQKG